MLFSFSSFSLKILLMTSQRLTCQSDPVVWVFSVTMAALRNYIFYSNKQDKEQTDFLYH